MRCLHEGAEVSTLPAVIKRRLSIRRGPPIKPGRRGSECRANGGPIDARLLPAPARFADGSIVVDRTKSFTPMADRENANDDKSSHDHR